MLLNNPWVKIGIVAVRLLLGLCWPTKSPTTTGRLSWANAERDAA